MKPHIQLLSQYICEQLALEESLYRDVEQQLADIADSTFENGKLLLQGIRDILEKHYAHLNGLLDQLDAEEIKQGDEESPNIRLVKSDVMRGGDQPGSLDASQRISMPRLSKVFSHNYSALYQIALSNSLLHSTALALKYEDAAAIALLHLQNIAPLLMKTGDLIPEIITRELQSDAMEVDSSAASIALKNLQAAWRSSF